MDVIIGLIWRVFKHDSIIMPCCSAWGCSNNSNKFQLYGFPFNKKRLAAWESNVNREGWKAKPGISKLCEVGVDIILRSRSPVGVAVGSTTLSFEISHVNKQGTCFHTMPKVCNDINKLYFETG